MTILEKLADLHEQATKERSHYYVGSVCVEAAATIVALSKALEAADRALGDMQVFCADISADLDGNETERAEFIATLNGRAYAENGKAGRAALAIRAALQAAAR